MTENVKEAERTILFLLKFIQTAPFVTEIMQDNFVFSPFDPWGQEKKSGHNHFSPLIITYPNAVVF